MMIHRATLRSFTLVLVTLFALAETPVARAQMVHYTTENTFKIDAFGAIGRMFGRKPITSSTYITREQSATVTGDAATIMDLKERKMISIDHRRKSYYEMTFDEMVQMFGELKADMEGQAQQAQAEQEGDTKVDYTFDVVVDDLGESDNIKGYKVDRKLIQIELSYTAEATDEDGNTETASGRFFAVTDAWVGPGVEGTETAQAFSRRYAEEMQTAFTDASSPLASIGQVLQQDQRIGPAFEKTAEEMKKLNGTPLRSTTYIVVVPEEMDLDVDLLLGRTKVEKKKGAALGKIAKGALKSRGIPVGGNNNAEAQKPAEQQTLLSMREEYTDIGEGAVDPSKFQVPAGYKQEPSPLQQMRQN